MFSAASVCLFVSLFVNMITSEWLNMGWRNWAVRCIVQKSRPSLNLGSKVKVTREKKNKKVRHFVWEPSSAARSSCGIFFRSSPRGHGYAGGKISAHCLLLLLRYCTLDLAVENIDTISNTEIIRRQTRHCCLKCWDSWQVNMVIKWANTTVFISRIHYTHNAWW